MLLLKKNLSHPLPLLCYNNHLNRAALVSSSPHLLTTLLGLSTATTRAPSPPNPPFITEYLINSCGLPRDKAIEASKYVAHLKTPSKPDSVLRFLNEQGFDEARIATLVSREPRLLTAGVETTLKPKMKALQRMGFSGRELIQLISENPSVLRISNLQPKIEFWRSLFGSNESVMKASRRNSYLFSCSLTKRILPNISLLRRWGISNHHIRALVLRSPRFITWRLEYVKALVKRAEKLGIPRGSGMFWHALQSVISTSEVTFNTKIELFKSFGWSEDEVLSAVRKTPVLLRLSEENIRGTMNFLLKEAGYRPSYVASLPVLLTYSLERRLIPRHYVLQSLKLKALPLGGQDLYGAIRLTNEMFLQKFVLPHHEVIPELYGAYVAASAGNVPSLVRS